MAAKKPVMCPNCGAHIRKNGYCPECGMNIFVLRKAWNTSDYYYNQGYDKACARDISGAIESLKISLRYNKKNIRARNLIGLCYYEMGEIIEALSHWVMSVNYKSEGNVAVKYLKDVKKDPVRLAECDAVARKFNTALSYIDSGDYDLAMIQLKNALSDNPHFVQGYLLLALLYMQAGNYEKARVTLRRVLKIDIANPRAIRYLREMGSSEENILELKNGSIDDDGLFEDMEYEDAGRETSFNKKKRETKKLATLKETGSESVVRTGNFSEVSLARYSGIYVLIGVVLGALLLFFVIVPKREKKLVSENDKLIRTYSEELSEKNSIIESQESQIKELQTQLEQKVEEEAKSTMPDYSGIKSGMSDEDIENMLDNE
ncbi:MAG: tetratricopeptide repeat protein [Lachnospiraceae bacterium]|nr:tetratricopeptide repeat protein [Lachnospiraceae bacterium]